MALPIAMEEYSSYRQPCHCYPTKQKLQDRHKLLVHARYGRVLAAQSFEINQSITDITYRQFHEMEPIQKLDRLGT